MKCLSIFAAGYILVGFLSYGFVYNGCIEKWGASEVHYCSGYAILLGAGWPLHWAGIAAIRITQ